jgi:hypothetical protein
MKRTEPTTDNLLEKIADESGLAVIVVDENSSVARRRTTTRSARFVRFRRIRAGAAPKIAGAPLTGEVSRRSGRLSMPRRLDCVAVPLKTEKPLVAIVGRAFTKAENYRRATERAITGDWSKFPPTRFFENVLIDRFDEGSRKKRRGGRSGRRVY